MKLKFNLDVKNFDFKQFFLKYGEWLGLGIALLITLPVVYSGIMKAATSGSSKSNAAELAKLTEGVKRKISQERPPAGTDAMSLDPALRVDSSLVDADKFAEENSFIVPSKLEDDKRREPIVLAPTDFHVDYVRAGILGNEFLKDGKSIKILALQETEANLRPRRKRRIQALQQASQALGGGVGGAMPPGAAGAMGQGMGQGMGQAAMGRGMGMGQGMGQPGQQQQRKTTISRPIYLDLADVEKRTDVRLAEVMYPVRMAVVTAAFPYKEQMEAFRTALRMKSLNELVDSNNAPFVFKGAIIMRRVFNPSGKLVSDWVDYTKPLFSEFANVMACVPGSPAPEDSELAKYADQMVLYGLVMPRPPLARGEYPKIDIKSLNDAIKTMTAADKDTVKPPPSFLQRKVSGKGFDPFNPQYTAGEEEPEKKPEPKTNQPKSRDNPGAGTNPEGPDLLIPEYVLVRFVDVTVQPGYSYEYKVKVRMENPNYLQKSKVAYRALADKPLVEATDFTSVPKITIPYDVKWYVTDEEGNRDQSQVQIHRWLGDVVTNTKDGASLPVADWSILERLDAHRGEYIGRPAKVQVAVWNPEKETYELAKTLGDTQAKSLPVDFTVRTLNAADPTLLVDYAGGRSRKTFEGRTVSDEEPVRFLVYTPEGKLVVQARINDEKNPAEEERKARVEEVKKVIAEAKLPPNKRNGQLGGNQGLFDGANKTMPGRGGLGGQ